MVYGGTMRDRSVLWGFYLGYGVLLGLAVTFYRWLGQTDNATYTWALWIGAWVWLIPTIWVFVGPRFIQRLWRPRLRQVDTYREPAIRTPEPKERQRWFNREWLPPIAFGFAVLSLLLHALRALALTWPRL